MRKARAFWLAVLAGMFLSGCIISAAPAPGDTISLLPGESQAFSVTAFLNKGFAWYVDGQAQPGETGENFTFTAAAADAGSIIPVQVTATDQFGQSESRAWSVAVTSPPVADAGADVLVLYGTAADLDGSASYDPEGEPLTYHWEIVSRPEGSTAEIEDATSVTAGFTPDVQGAYEIGLTVNDGLVDSPLDSLMLTTFTYNLDFENALTPWEVTRDDDVAFGITNEQVFGGSQAFEVGPADDIILANNDLRLRLVLDAPIYVYSISAAVYSKAGSIGHGDLIINGENVSGIGEGLTPGTLNTWIMREWAINQEVTKISFNYQDLGTLSHYYIDEIVINTWCN